jgi:hypothetical protein
MQVVNLLEAGLTLNEWSKNKNMRIGTEGLSLAMK